MTVADIRYTAVAATLLIIDLGLSSIASAQSSTGTRAPDPNRGATIAAQGTAAGAPGCAQCHAFNGASDGTGAFPRIAGPSAYYLAKQLRDFGSGVRDNPVMSPIAKPLTPAHITALSAHPPGPHIPYFPT